MQTRYFKTEQAARFYARNMTVFKLENAVAPNNPHPLIRLVFDENQPIARITSKPETKGAITRTPSELVQLKADNAELRRALAACADALEKRNEYKAQFLKLVVKHARAALGE